jgi:hypothetical protein
MLLSNLTAVTEDQGNISITQCWRDRGQLDDDQLPAAYLLDGTEDIAMDVLVSTRKSVKMPPAIFAMHPQIWVVVKQRDRLDNLTIDGQPAAIGPELSAWRLAVRERVENDAGLLSLLTTSGQITFLGSETDMRSGGLMRGHLQMKYEFRFPLFPPNA